MFEAAGFVLAVRAQGTDPHQRPGAEWGESSPRPGSAPLPPKRGPWGRGVTPNPKCGDLQTPELTRRCVVPVSIFTVGKQGRWLQATSVRSSPSRSRWSNAFFPCRFSKFPPSHFSCCSRNPGPAQREGLRWVRAAACHVGCCTARRLGARGCADPIEPPFMGCADPSEPPPNCLPLLQTLWKPRPVPGWVCSLNFVFWVSSRICPGGAVVLEVICAAGISPGSQAFMV